MNLKKSVVYIIMITVILITTGSLFAYFIYTQMQEIKEINNRHNRHYVMFTTPLRYVASNNVLEREYREKCKIEIFSDSVNIEIDGKQFPFAHIITDTNYIVLREHPKEAIEISPSLEENKYDIFYYSTDTTIFTQYVNCKKTVINGR